MKLIKYFNKVVTQENPNGVITPLEYKCSNEEFAYWLDVITKSYGQYGMVTSEDADGVETSIANNSLQIIKAYSTTQPLDVAIVDKTTYWEITVTRNVTANGTGFDYEYIEFPTPKTGETQTELTSLITAKKDEIFANAQYPLSQIYYGTTNNTDLLKLNFVLIDKITALETEISSLKGGA